MLQIEWKSSHYHSDGRKRSRPKASTVHGWLVKWRATFSGNERLRKEGIREMREAKAVRKWKKQQKATRLAKAGTSKFLSCLWPILLGRKKRQYLQASKPRAGAGHSSAKRPSRGSTRHLTSPTYSPRPTPTNSRRSSHNRPGVEHYNPRGSRKGSHDSRRGTGTSTVVRAGAKKR